MSEDVNAATKLYIKDADEEVRKDFKEDLRQHRAEVDEELKKAKRASTIAFVAITTAIGLATVICSWLFSSSAVSEGLKQKNIQAMVARIQEHELVAVAGVQHITDLKEKAENSGLLLPIGTILPVSGSLDKIKELEKHGWYVCDGTTEGVPDLTDRFLRGSGTSGEMDDAVTSTGHRNGGTDLDEHKHETPITNSFGKAGFTNGSPWGTGSDTGKKDEVPIRGSGGKYPSKFKLTNTAKGYKLNQHTHSVSIVPKYYSVIYIMRVR